MKRKRITSNGSLICCGLMKIEMAKTREEVNAYQRRIQAQQSAYREKNGIEAPSFIAPKDVHDVEWKSISQKTLRNDTPFEEQSGLGEFLGEWEDY